jgi:hypothetical protein
MRARTEPGAGRGDLRRAARRIAALILCATMTPAKARAAGSATEPAARLAVLPILVAGDEGSASSSDLHGAVASSARLRPGLQVLTAEELFLASQEGVLERVRDCGSDEACISERLQSMGAQLGLVLLLNFQLAPPLISLRLLDAEAGRELGRSVGELAAAESSGSGLGARLASETASLLERAGFRQGGLLRVEVEPETAAISIDGVERERGTANVFVLAAGPHTIEARLDGHDAALASAVLARGEEQRVRMRLERQTSLFASPWFWTILGAVVVGSAVTVAAVTYDRPESVCFSAAGQPPCASRD